MNVTTRWCLAQNAAKTKKAVDVIIVGAYDCKNDRATEMIA